MRNFEEKNFYQVGIERAFVSCIIKNPQLVREASALISPEDLFSTNFKIIYNTILEMNSFYNTNRREPDFSIGLVINWIEKNEEVREKFLISVGKMEYVKNILNAPDTSIESFHNYIEILKDTSVRVRAYRTSDEIKKRIVNAPHTEPIIDIMSDINKMVNDVHNARNSGTGMVRLGDCVEELMDLTKFNYDNKGKVGIWLNKFPRLMKVLGGIRDTQFIVLFARPKTGKSTYLLNMAVETAMQGIPALYIDTEMTQEEQVSRAISLWSGVKEWDIMSGSFYDDEEKCKTVHEYCNKVKDLPLYYVAAKGASTDFICNAMREFVETRVGYLTTDKGVKKAKQCLVIYDWLKISDAGSVRDVKEYQELGFITTKLNDTRRELGIPLIAGAQANRSGVSSDDVDSRSAGNAQAFLADSDRILRFCTCLIWLRRLGLKEMEIMKDLVEECPEKTYNQMIHVVDQRGGPVCLEGIGLDFTGATLTYEEKDVIDLVKEKQNKSTKSTPEERFADIEKKNDIGKISGVSEIQDDSNNLDAIIEEDNYAPEL